jgi:predicted RNA methylase
MLATGVELLAALAPPTAHVLDLGAGTGAVGRGARWSAGARVTLLDVDTEMLDEGQRRLAPFAERVRVREASFLDPLPAADAVAPRWRSITSMTSTPRPISTARSTTRWPRRVCF